MRALVIVALATGLSVAYLWATEAGGPLTGWSHRMYVEHGLVWFALMALALMVAAFGLVTLPVALTVGA